TTTATAAAATPTPAATPAPTARRRLPRLPHLRLAIRPATTAANTTAAAITAAVSTTIRGVGTGGAISSPTTTGTTWSRRTTRELTAAWRRGGPGSTFLHMPITSGDEYIQSLRGRKLRVFLFGERVEEPVDHPMIRPSINAVAETYELARREPEIATAQSSLTQLRVNRFLHVTESVDDVVAQNRMQRRLGQLTGTCFQRCVGMDALNSL